MPNFTFALIMIKLIVHKALHYGEGSRHSIFTDHENVTSHNNSYITRLMTMLAKLLIFGNKFVEALVE